MKLSGCFISLSESQNRTLLLFAIPFAISISTTLSLLLLATGYLNSVLFFILFVLLIVVLSIAIYIALQRIKPLFTSYSLKIKLLWIICCAFVGGLLLLVIPINTRAPSYHEIKITATGNHNTQSKGSEVWLYSIEANTGTGIPKRKIIVNQGWENREGTILSYENQPASIEYRGFLFGDLSLTFGSHPWSGEVQIHIDNNDMIVDLYSDDLTSKTINLDIEQSPILNLLVLVNAILSLSFVVFLLSVLLTTSKYKHDEINQNIIVQNNFVKPETIFLILAISFGLLYVFLTPPFQVADENQHFNYAYAVSNGQYFGYKTRIPRSIYDLVVATNNLPTNPSEKILYNEILDFINIPLNTNDTYPTTYQGTAKVNPVPYLPMAFTFSITKLLNLNTLEFFFIGRVVHLSIWILVCYFALKILPEFKWVFLLLILSPMSLSIAGSYSADAITNSVSFLWICMCYKYSLPNEKIISKQSRIGLLALSAILSLLKPPYFLLLGLLFLIPQSNFGSRKRYKHTIILIFSISIILIIFSLSYLTNDISTTNSRINIDFTDQMNYLIKHPLEFRNIVFRSVKLFGNFYYTSYIGRLGWLDTILPKYVYSTYWIVILITILLDNNWQLRITPWQKVLSLAISCTIFYSVFLSLYLTWTPVGYSTLEGMQGRYLIPIVPSLLPVFHHKINFPQKKWISIFVTAYLIFVLSATVRTLIFRFYIC